MELSRPEKLALEKQMTSEVDQVTEHGEQKYIPRCTEVMSNIEEVLLARGTDEQTSELEDSCNDESTQGGIRLSLFKTENGTSLFPKQGMT